MNALALVIAVFQFQYGAIGGVASLACLFFSRISIPVWCDWWVGDSAPGELVPYFNSSMVRLVAISGELAWTDNSFQFQYGAIGGQTRLVELFRLGYFNSSMVRLVGSRITNGSDF